jgi:hypothetical protein
MSAIVSPRPPIASTAAVALWVPGWIAFVIASVLVQPQPRMICFLVAAVLGLVALARTRGRGFLIGVPAGLLAGAVAIGVIWYVDTHGFTIGAALVVASAVVATAIVIGARIVARSRRLT